MILEAAVINLTRNLDIICQQGKKGISSHDKLKKEALGCLANLLKNAPDSEYTHLIKSADSEILLGYLLSILCNLAKDDKSKPIRLLSVETIEVLIERLELLHMRSPQSLNDKCGIATVIVALPGVSSSLFRTIMSDTKLPKSFLVKSIQVLTKFIVVAFLPCHHHHEPTSKGQLQPTMDGKNLLDTCDNLATRIGFMLNYVMSNTSSLHSDIQYATLDLCLSLLKETRNELVTRTITSIIRYMAFISSNQECFGGANAENQVKLMIMTDEIKSKMGSGIQEEDSIESTVLNCLFKRLDNLHENALTMLISERESELAMLCGLIKLLPPEVITTVLEVDSRKDQLLAILIKLVEFSVDQPFLFLTESQVGEDALDVTGARVYTIEKRFSHLTEKEITLVQTCCNCLGATTNWPLLVDVLRNDLMQFSDPNHLYIALQVLQGCLNRNDLNELNASQLTSQSLQAYREAIHECSNKVIQDGPDNSYSCDILKSVIAIETTLTLVELHLKFVKSNSSRRIIILKDLLCPLLDWSSSSSRAISEASLNTLTLISRLYGLKSTKELIEQHTDYIVDGVSKMLDNFICNPEVTNVLAITFKLSSIETFYYFKDVYAQVFRVLAKYHNTKQSSALALLLYRTVTIIGDWKDSLSGWSNGATGGDVPLTTEDSIKAVKLSLDIGKIIEKLHNKSEEARQINEGMENMQVTDEDERKVAQEIQSGQQDRPSEPCNENAEEDAEKKNERPDDGVLVEKIMKHCIGLMSSNYSQTKILALKTAACGFRVLRDDENTLLPLVHQTWAPLLSRLTQDYMKNLEENLCAFECLIAMAVHARDFIKRRTLDAIIPRLCLFLESQVHQSRGKKPYEPYCMTIIYKCQLRILGHLGQLAYCTQIAYTSLWRIIGVCLKYLDTKQVSTLHEAAAVSLKYLIALDADCVWFFAKQCGKLRMLPFDLIFELPSADYYDHHQEQMVTSKSKQAIISSLVRPKQAH